LPAGPPVRRPAELRENLAAAGHRLHLRWLQRDLAALATALPTGVKPQRRRIAGSGLPASPSEQAQLLSPQDVLWLNCDFNAFQLQ
jgi:hypothetical protein